MTDGEVDRPIRIWNTPRRWASLQFNTTADLYEHLDAVASWLEQARHAVLVPLVEAYDPATIRWSIDAKRFSSGSARRAACDLWRLVDQEQTCFRRWG